MLIRELSETTGIPVDTIRFYEKRGLLTEKHFCRRDNNYRDYAETAVARLERRVAALQSWVGILGTAVVGLAVLNCGTFGRALRFSLVRIRQRRNHMAKKQRLLDH